jgi:hypothetical protein
MIRAEVNGLSILEGKHFAGIMPNQAKTGLLQGGRKYRSEFKAISNYPIAWAGE